MFKKFGQKLQSRKGKVVMGYFYGWGASVVLIGALFKLTHWLPGQAANIMLAIGLFTEAFIFIPSKAKHSPQNSFIMPSQS